MTEAPPAGLSLKERVTEASFDFIQKMPLAAFIVDRGRDVFLGNPALAAAFAYSDLKILEDRLRQGVFFPSHFSPETIGQFHEMLSAGRVEGWLMHGQDLKGQDVTLEITARARLRTPQGPADFMEAFFVAPGNVRDAEAFLQKAKKEAELAARAKTEFLSNISHELRTPLNIIIGMLDLAVEDESVADDLRLNLGLAKDAADGLFTIVNDLIILSNLEARRLTLDVAQFSANMLLQSLASQFSAKAGEKGCVLRTEGDERGDEILDGGYNLIVMAMEKLTDNAIKFAGEKGEVILQAEVVEKGDGPWLRCSVLDNGPGLDECFLEPGAQELFRQGDGSMNRKHGGLGLGLRLAGNLVTALGGRLTLANRDCGGAELSFIVPVKFSLMTADEGDDE